ncbi:MAG: hypothetical protein SGJ21_03450 [Alphaproteobacteria bacterium]|nr:hypothetical protein [Alphaproteobacteria bacterium]
MTRYSVEFVVTGFGEVEILARGKPKAEEQSDPEPEAPVKTRRPGRGKAAAGEAVAA